MQNKLEIGKTQTLKVVKPVDFGWYLDGLDYGEILLPAKYAPENLQVAEDISVFVYMDTEDRPIATTETPIVERDGMAVLEIVDVAKFGAFAHWGLLKDLLIPANAQAVNLEIGDKALVKVYLDEESRRLAGTTKIEPFLLPVPENDPNFEPLKKVKVCVYASTPLGYKCVVNDIYSGLIYHNELAGKLPEIGDVFETSIKHVREDGKLDLYAHTPNYDDKIQEIVHAVVSTMQNNGGFLPIHDKSSPEAVHEWVAMSKKSFKQAVGFLYKHGKIKLEKKGIRWVEN